MSEPNFMWGDIFPPKGQRDFTERDMVKVAAMHAESQAEIVALRARVAELERIRCPDGNRHIWDYGYCKKCRQHAADLIDAALATEGE